MKRNLEERVEVITPVEPDDLRTKLREILDIQLADQRSGWDMQADGTYIQRNPSERAEQAGSQEIFIQLAGKRLADAQRMSKKKNKKKKIVKRKRK